MPYTYREGIFEPQKEILFSCLRCCLCWLEVLEIGKGTRDESIFMPVCEYSLQAQEVVVVAAASAPSEYMAIPRSLFVVIPSLRFAAAGAGVKPLPA